MSEPTPLGEIMSNLWSPPGQAFSYEEARAKVLANELDDLRALGVNVDDPEALATAKADAGLMAQHRGRQLRAIRAMLPQPRPFDPRGLSEAIKAARERLFAAERLRSGS